MVRQPPLLLSRVIRAIAALGDPKGSSLPEIISQVKVALDAGMKSDSASRKSSVRNIPTQVKRAVRHAMDRKLLLHRTGRYRLAARSRLIPVDSMEFAADYKKRRSNVAKTAAITTVKSKRYRECLVDACKCKKKGKSRRRKSKKCKRRSSSCSRRRRKKRSRKSKSSSCRSSRSSRKSKRSKSCSKSGSSRKRKRSRSTSKCGRADTPIPGSTTSIEEKQNAMKETDDKSFRESRLRRTSHRTNHSPFRPPTKVPSEGPPNVNDEPMDSSPGQYKHSHRPQEMHQQRLHQHQHQYQHQRQHQQQSEDEDKSEIDSLDEDLDRPPSYYN